MTNKMNCLLVHPGFSKKSALNYADVCRIMGAKYPIPPLGLITVAALLPRYWNFKLVDLNTEPLKDEFFKWADIVCTGGMLSQQPGILSVIRKAHQYRKKTVVGGPDPTCQPDLYTASDYLVIGEGENTIPLFLEDLKNGIQKGIYRNPGTVNMTRTVIPRYDLMRFSDYLMVGMQYSRGCPYNCEFCNVIELFGRKQRVKSFSQIIDELQCLFDLGYRGHIFFIDDNFLSNGPPVEILLKEIAAWSEKKKYPFYFQAEASVNLAENETYLQLLKNANFRYLSIGLETVEDHVLKMAQKPQNMHKLFPGIVRKILSYGIMVDASFILGFDNESDQTASLLMNTIQESGICMAMIGTLYALPNTQLEKRLKNEGRLLDEAITIHDPSAEIDQMSSGLNFVTIREKSSILKDYATILSFLYDPANYYKRLTYTGLHLHPCNRYRPGFSQIMKRIRGFFRVTAIVGFNRETGLYFWKTLLAILFRNPKAIEPVVSFAAMYIHLAKHSKFIINITNERIKTLN
jgi:radical SAM superfamily enzyme YgiQ (UPF0313 family)